MERPRTELCEDCLVEHMKALHLVEDGRVRRVDCVAMVRFVNRVSSIVWKKGEEGDDESGIYHDKTEIH